MDDDPSEPTSPPRSGTQGFFKRLWRSCHDSSFYRIPVRESLPTSFLYAARLFLILGTIWGSLIALHYGRQTNRLIAHIQPQLPSISLHNGKLTVQAQVPYTITLPDRSRIILDPEGSLNRRRLLSDTPPVKAVIVDRVIYVRSGAEQYWNMSTRTHPSDEEAPAIQITPRTIEEWKSLLGWSVMGLTFLFTMIGVFIQGTLRILVFSVGGLIARSGLPDMATWKDSLKIASYAVTPMFSGEIFLSTVGLSFFGMEYLFLGGGILLVFTLILHLEESTAEPPPSGKAS